MNQNSKQIAYSTKERKARRKKKSNRKRKLK